MGARRQLVALPGQLEHFVGGVLRRRAAHAPARLHRLRARSGRGNITLLLTQHIYIALLKITRWRTNPMASIILH